MVPESAGCRSSTSSWRAFHVVMMSAVALMPGQASRASRRPRTDRTGDATAENRAPHAVPLLMAAVNAIVRNASAATSAFTRSCSSPISKRVSCRMKASCSWPSSDPLLAGFPLVWSFMTASVPTRSDGSVCGEDRCHLVLRLRSAVRRFADPGEGALDGPVRAESGRWLERLSGPLLQHLRLPLLLQLQRLRRHWGVEVDQ